MARALRLRWPGYQYCAFVEFTSGCSATSRGWRRMHAHVLIKGIPVEDLGEAQEVAGRVWRGRTGAGQVTCEPIRTHAGLANYLARHDLKPDQAPPPWWHGKRVRPSQGYFHRPVTEIRAMAKAALAADRRRYAAERRLGPGASADEVSALAATMDVEASRHDWRPLRVRESAHGVVVPVDGGGGHVGSEPRAAVPAEAGVTRPAAVRQRRQPRARVTPAHRVRVEWPSRRRPPWSRGPGRRNRLDLIREILLERACRPPPIRGPCRGPDRYPRVDAVG